MSWLKYLYELGKSKPKEPRTQSVFLSPKAYAGSINPRILFPEWYRKKGRGYVRTVNDDIHYIVENHSSPVRPDNTSCHYCGGELDRYAIKHKSESFILEKQPPPHAGDLHLQETWAFIVIDLRSSCSRCNAKYEPSTSGLLNSAVSSLRDRRYSGEYKVEVIDEIMKKGADFCQWTIEEIPIKWPDAFDWHEDRDMLFEGEGHWYLYKTD